MSVLIIILNSDSPKGYIESTKYIEEMLFNL